MSATCSPCGPPPGREIILIGKNNDKVQAVAPATGTQPLQ
jgi:hypothetical protein